MNILIIEGKEADLIAKTVNINFQINYIGDISTRNSTFSNTIDLPRTSNNEAIFGMLGVMGSGSRTPYKKLRCTYIQDNITLINGGYLQVTEITPDSFKCNIFDGIIDLAEKLKGKTLENLFFDPIILNMSNYQSSFSNTDGFIYALGHYDKAYPITVFEQVTWEITKQSPSLFIHSIFDKILTEAGFTYEGDIFSDAGYKSEVTTLTKGFETIDKTKLVNVITNNNWGFLGSDNWGYTKFQFMTEDVNPTITVSNDRITSTTTQNLILDINATTKATSGSVDIQILKNGISVDVKNINEEGGFRYTYNISMNSGDYIEIRSKGNATTVGTFYSATLKIGVYESLTNSVVDIKSHIGDNISQIDFIKDVMQRYGLVMKVDTVNKNHLYFKDIETLLNDRDNVIDLTDMFDYEKSVKYVSDMSKINTAKYEYVDEIKEPTHNADLLVDNENLKVQSTLFESPYTISSRDVTTDAYGQTIPTYDIYLWDGKLEKDENDAEFFNYNNLETDSRIFKLGNWNSTTRLSFNNAPYITVSSIPILTLNNVSMDYYLFNYYPSFNNLMDDYKEITVQMNLNTIDLLKMDFFKLVYLKQYQAYFYLQRYTNNGEVKLLQIKKFR